MSHRNLKSCQNQMPKIRMLRGGGRPATIKITNVKSIKPPDPEMQKKQDEVELRAQVKKEIESRFRICAHRGYECTESVLSGQSYCARHVLADPKAPYKQCAHVYSNGQRCAMLAPDDRRDHRDQGLCFEHARLSMQARQRSAAPPPPVITTETLLNQLQHYIRPERARTTSCASSVSVVSDPAEQEQVSTNPVDPFKQIDAAAVNSAVSASIMECASDTDSDCDSVLLGPGGNCRALCDHEPEADEAPVERTPLWNAGVFTLEEAISETRSILRSLQGAYLQQTGRLRTLLHIARADYLRSLRAERDSYCSINTQAKSGPLTVRERQQLRKLKAYGSYHRKHGVEAVLARKLHRKRARANEFGPSRPIPSQARCVFTEGGVRCENQGLPAAKHCKKHIMLDKHQVLFVPCGDERGGAPCKEPRVRLPEAHRVCRYHAGHPPYNDLMDPDTKDSPKKEDQTEHTESHSTTDESQMEQLEDASTERSPLDEQLGPQGFPLDMDPGRPQNFDDRPQDFEAIPDIDRVLPQGFATIPDIDNLQLDPLPFA